MTDKPTFVIDGSRFSTLAGFYDEIDRSVLRGAFWGRNLDALNDIMRGDVGPLPEEFRLVWKDAALSKQRLSGTGPGSFADLFDIITSNVNVELSLE
jgi:RNAse (barnase) inhibitor barstar